MLYLWPVDNQLLETAQTTSIEYGRTPYLVCKTQTQTKFIQHK